MLVCNDCSNFDVEVTTEGLPADHYVSICTCAANGDEEIPNSTTLRYSSNGEGHKIKTPRLVIPRPSWCPL